MAAETNVNNRVERKRNLWRGLLLGVTVVVLTGFTIMLTLVNYVDANAADNNVTYVGSEPFVTALQGLYNAADKTTVTGYKEFSSSHTLVLTSDKTLDTTSLGNKVPGNTTLDLNGNTLTITGNSDEYAFYLQSGIFRICDSSAGGNGKIVFKANSVSGACLIHWGNQFTDRVVLESGGIMLRSNYFVGGVSPHVDILGGSINYDSANYGLLKGNNGTLHYCGGRYYDYKGELQDKSHNLKTNTTPATCTTAGKQEIYCDCCHTKINTETLAALGHNYQSTVTPPTCTTGGYTTYNCTRCKDEYTANAVNALGHDWGQWVIDQVATTEQEGSMHRNCRVCDAVDTATIPLHEHTYANANAETILPSCTLSGFTRHYCDSCSYYYDDNHAAALGHAYQDVVTAPTCTTDGYTKHTCARCNATYNDTPEPALGHSWGEWVVDTAPTASSAGQQHHLCTVCGEKATATIAPLAADNEPADFDWVTAGVATGVCVGLVGAGGTVVVLLRRKRRLGH